MTRNLSEKGLSLSQAQSISNLCNQRAIDIASTLTGINNAEKSLTLNNKEYIETPGKSMPGNVLKLLLEKSRLHACQAFLMEHIRLKDKLIQEAQKESMILEIKQPGRPEMVDYDMIPSVDETWGWKQLSNSEMNEYLEAEAFASHIGLFIHKGGVLDTLRTELPKIKTLEWMEVKKDEKLPLTVKIHHTSAELLELHNTLAAEHRQYEQKVNYFKSKVKNLVTTENARIANENAKAAQEANEKNQVLRNDYSVKFNAYQEDVTKLTYDFENKRQEKIKSIAALRIEIDPRFQPVIDLYLPKVVTE